MGMMRSLGLAACIAAILTTAPAMAETKWVMATGYPDDSYFTENIRQFIQEIEEKTNGELTIDLRSNDTLIKHDAIKRAVQSGQIQIGEIRLAVYGNEDPIYDLDNLPNLVADYDDAWQLMEAQKPYFDEIFASNGMRVLAYAPWPGQGFYTAQPVTSLEDLQGQSIRIYSRQTQKMGELLGMEATILPFAEIPQAFSTGLIEALWTSAQTGTDVQAWDYVEHFTYTGSMHNKNAIIVNEAAFQALDEETQKIVIAAGEKATERGWELSKEASEKREQTLRDHGMQTAKAPADVMQKMAEIGETMVQEWRQTAGEEKAKALDAYLEAKD
jgi:TRAP-type C4-dicarboxylate transport system substrate-binding protein